MKRLPTFADPAQLAESFRRLRPGGHALVYAVADHLPPQRNETLRLVDHWIASGEALALPQMRDREHPEFWLFRVTRSCRVNRADVRSSASQSSLPGRGPPVSEPLEAAECSFATVRPESPPLTDSQFWDSPLGEVYAHLRKVAKLGLACPSNETLAEELGFETARQARYIMQRLQEAGHIRLIEPARFGPRVIEIASSGMRTKASLAVASANVRSASPSSQSALPGRGPGGSEALEAPLQRKPSQPNYAALGIDDPEGRN